MHPLGETSRLFWLTQSLGDVPLHDEWLSRGERTHLERLRFPKRRSQWRLGRWTAKCALLRVAHARSGWPSETIPSGVPKTPQAERTAFEEFAKIDIRPAADGAPEIFVRDERLPIALSISHRDEIGMCVIGPLHCAVGCDVELIEHRSGAFIADFLALEEQRMVTQASAADRARISTLIWSAKESALKALRQGLRLDTRSVIVDLAPVAVRGDSPQAWHPLTVRYEESRRQFQGWWRQQGEYVQSVVAAPASGPPVAVTTSA